jgi:hypothetical protein
MRSLTNGREIDLPNDWEAGRFGLGHAGRARPRAVLGGTARLMPRRRDCDLSISDSSVEPMPGQWSSLGGRPSNRPEMVGVDGWEIPAWLSRHRLTTDCPVAVCPDPTDASVGRLIHASPEVGSGTVQRIRRANGQARLKGLPRHAGGPGVGPGGLNSIATERHRILHAQQQPRPAS